MAIFIDRESYDIELENRLQKPNHLDSKDIIGVFFCYKDLGFLETASIKTCIDAVYIKGENDRALGNIILCNCVSVHNHQ